MNSIKHRAATALVLSSVLSGVALAGHVVSASATEDKAPAPAPVAGTSTIGLQVQETQMIATGWRASKLISAEVVNDKKEKIGKVEDLVVAPGGTVSAAVIEVGGFLGMGKHQVAIPTRQLTPSNTGTKVTLPGATKESLKNLPEFKYAKPAK